MAELQEEKVSKKANTRAFASVCMENEELQKKLEDEKKKSDQYQQSVLKLNCKNMKCPSKRTHKFCMLSVCMEIEELQKKLEEEKKKSDQYQQTVLKLEERVSNLESGNQVLRKEALVISPTDLSSSARPKTTIIPAELQESKVSKRAKTRVLDAVCMENEELQKKLEDEKKKSDRLEQRVSNLESEFQAFRKEALVISPTDLTSSGMQEPETEETPQQILNEKQQENQDMLIKSISQDLGFSKGMPVAARLIFKCLVKWKSFEAERTSIFDRIIQTIARVIESQDNSLNNDVLSYWLSNCATLFLLLQRKLKASGAASLTPQRGRTLSTPLFTRMSQQLRGSPRSAGFSFYRDQPLNGLDVLLQVEAKYPALLFKQQITAFLEKIYGMIRDNLKKEISSVLAQCIQAPRQSRSQVQARSQANAISQQALVAHWQNIVKSLNLYLNTMRANHVPSFLVHKVFAQTFFFINVQLFNSFLLRRECCSFSNGEYVKSGLSELEIWCRDATEEYAGSSWDELKHTRQAVGFLVIHQKPKKSLREITNDLCPTLSIQQLYRISTAYWDDKYVTDSVSAEVIQSMRVTMIEESGNSESASFLLDDDSSIPFTVDDIAKSMKPVEMVNVDLPPLLRDHPDFAFSLQ